MENAAGSRWRSARSVSSWEEDCAALLSILNELDDSAPFRRPVNLDEYPDYFEVIDTPMDLMTVGDKLTNGIYASPEEFARDMTIIFANSRTYNTNKRSRIYTMTLRLSAMFESRMPYILRNHEAATKR